MQPPPAQCPSVIAPYKFDFAVLYLLEGMTMLLCSPAGVPLARSFAIAARPASLAGLRIGLFDNTKAPVDKIMDYLTPMLTAHVPGARILRFGKQHPSLPVEADVFARMRGEVDVVINALGD